MVTDNRMGKPLIKKSSPTNWRWMELQGVSRLVAGASAPQGDALFADSGAWFVRVSDLGGCDSDGVLRATRDRLSELAIATKPVVRVPKGAVVLPKSGAAIATNRRAILGMDAYIVGHLLALIPIPEMILTEWLYFALRQIDMVEHSENISYPSLKKSVVANIEIPLPPLSEQKRIVAMLEGQMEVVGKARRAALEQVEAVQALSLAWLRESFSFGGSNLPHGWRWVALGDVCEVAGEYGSNSRRVNFDGSVRYVRITDIDNYGNLKESNVVSPSVVERRYFLQKGDLLFARSGSVGRCYLHQIEKGAYQYASYLIRYKTLPDILLPEYMFCITRSEYWQQWVKTKSKTATLANINARQFSSFAIPLPPLAEQRRLVSDLNAKMAAAKNARAAAEAELEAIEALPGALLRQAFRGEL